MTASAKVLIKGSSLKGVLFAVQIVVSFFLTPFMVLSLGDRMYGFWTMVMTFAGYYGLLDLGLTHAVNRFMASAVGSEDFDECNRVFNTSLMLFSVAGIAVLFVSCLVVFFTPLVVEDPSDANLFQQVILVLGINMAVEFPVRAYLGVLTAQLRYDIDALLQFLTLVLRSTCIVLALISGYQVLAIALVTVFAGIPQKLLMIYYARKSLPEIKISRNAWTLSTAKTLFSYSGYAFVGKIARILKYNVDVIVVSVFLGLSAVTHYSIGSMLALYMRTFMGSILGFMIPVFSRYYGQNDIGNVHRAFFFVNKLSIYIAAFIGFGMIFWGSAFIERWMGNEFVDAYPVLFVLVLANMIFLYQVPSVEILMSTAGYKAVAIFHVIEGIANLILSVVLVQHFGLVGVALGTLIPLAIVKIFVQPIYVIRVLDVGSLVYFKRVAKSIIISSVSLVLPGIFSVMFVRPSYDMLFGIGAISAALYSASIYRFGFDSAEIASIKEAMNVKKQKLRFAG